MTACAAEEAATEDSPAEAATVQVSDTEAGAAQEDSPADAATAQVSEMEAGTVLAAALAEAEKTGRQVFVHTGADW